MRTMEIDQTALMRKLIWVFVEHTLEGMFSCIETHLYKP